MSSVVNENNMDLHNKTIDNADNESNSSASSIPSDVSPDGYDGDNEDQQSVEGQDSVNEVADESEEPPQPESMVELVESMRALLDDDDLSELDPDVKQRIRDFRYAQKQRSKKYHLRPFGIVGLFSNLSDIRSDLRWAEHVAYRKRRGKSILGWKEFEKRRTGGLIQPYFTYMLVLVNIAMMLVAFERNDWMIEPLHINPLIGPTPNVLLELGALQTREMIETGSWYRLVTAMFLHAGILHLVVNVGVIALIGRVVERNHGCFQTSLLFLIPALGGNLISAVMQPGSILVGASGGIFGLIGALVADIVLNWKLMFLVFKQHRGYSGCWIRFLCAFWLVFDLFINSIIGFTPYVDNFAHMGGLVYGFLLALTILSRLPLSFFGTGSDCCHLLKIYSLRFLGTAIACFLIAISAMLLRNSDGLLSPCLQCRYISCIPFPFWTDNKWWRCDGCDAISGDIFMRNGDAFFSDLELFCQNGEIAHVDIFDERFSDAFEVEAELPRFCRENC